jgi:HAD superfamily hydrolase (TIGR01549 family)
MKPLIEHFNQGQYTGRVILFDYDSTIAKVPVDWPKARGEYRKYLEREFPELPVSETARVDEMEALALRHFPESNERIFYFRNELESALDGGHEPLAGACELIRYLRGQGGYRMFIVSNNLNRTVEVGLKQLELRDAFEAIFGVDDVGMPKPEVSAFEMLEEQYGLVAENCVFIGDNDRTDGGFCKSAGIEFINITQV